MAAEAGIAASVLTVLLGLLLLAVAVLRRSAAAAWAVAVFGAQAAIDYTYRYAGVVMVAAAVAGLTLRDPHPDGGACAAAPVVTR